jgi:hypothetical protein
VRIISHEELGLVNKHIHLTNEKTVSRDAVSSFKKHNVANDKIVHEDTLACTVLAAENGNFLLIDFILEVEELLLLSVITDGGDKGSKDHSEGHREGLKPGILFVGVETGQKLEGSKYKEKLGEAILKLFEENVPVGADGGESAGVFAEAKDRGVSGANYNTISIFDRYL